MCTYESLKYSGISGCVLGGVSVRVIDGLHGAPVGGKRILDMHQLAVSIDKGHEISESRHVKPAPQ